MSFPGLWTFILPQSSSFKKLASQLTDLQQIEAAEVSKYLSLLDVLVYAQSSKQASFQSPGLLAGTVNMTQLLQFATPKFVHAFCEASASTMSHSGHATLTELHLPARCFTDSNIKPLEPIQEHLSSLCKLSITSSVFFGPSLRQLKAPFADFVSKLAPHSSLMQLSIEVPDLPEKAKRLAACKLVQRLIKSVQSLKTLTALQLSAPFAALDSRPTFLTAFPTLVHLHLGIRGEEEKVGPSVLV